MIRANSPYYISVPWVSLATGLPCTSYTLSVWVWDGLKASVPATAEYTFTKNNSAELTSGEDTTINISRVILDFIDPMPTEGTTTGTYGSNSTRWVKWSYTYVTTNPTDATTPQGVSTELFSRGYSYGFEGGNIETITNNIFFQGNEFKADRTSFYSLPIALSEGKDITVSAYSYPANEISFFVTETPTTTSGQLAQSLWVNLSETTTDKYVTITVQGLEVATILIEDECKYTPLDIFFINKLGIQQSFTFFKEQKHKLTVKSSEFESDRGQPSLGNHQFVKYNVQARGEFNVFTGFIDESNNETIQQMLLSEKVWSYDGAKFTPLNVKSNSQQWKTQRNDKLINYSIDFEYSYNTINNI